MKASVLRIHHAVRWRRPRFRLSTLLASILALGLALQLVLYGRDERKAAEEIGIWGSVGHGPSLMPDCLPWELRTHFSHVESVSLYGRNGAPFARLLPRFPHLRTLSLVGPEFNDSHIDAVLLLRELEELSIVNASVTDGGLARLGALRNLCVLNLHKTRVGSGALAAIGSLPSLRILMLSDTSLRDGDLKHLRGVRTLEQLYLGGNDVSDAALEHFVPLAQLRLLSLRGTRVTRDGMARYRSSRPKCLVVD